MADVITPLWLRSQRENISYIRSNIAISKKDGGAGENAGEVLPTPGIPPVVNMAEKGTLPVADNTGDIRAQQDQGAVKHFSSEGIQYKEQMAPVSQSSA